MGDQTLAYDQHAKPSSCVHSPPGAFLNPLKMADL